MEQSSRMRYDDGGWAECIGGHVVLDLVNTVAWRLDPDRTVDRLTDGAALVRWAGFAGMLSDDQADALAREVADDEAGGRRVAARVRGLRDRLYAVLEPVAVQGEPAPADLVALQRWLLDVLRRTELTTVMPLRWSAGVQSIHDLADALGLRTWSLLDQEDGSRLRQCQDEACGWLFLDRTRNGSRVWCSSGDCGNRSRARRHYRRHTQPRSRQAAGGKP